jgi:hypothetical protein
MPENEEKLIAKKYLRPQKQIVMTKKKRAIADKGTQIPMQRFELYKSAFAWINYAINCGFYLEAITLIESVLSDRIESRLTYLDTPNANFRPLGKLIEQLKVNEKNEDVIKFIIEIYQWKESRNELLHEMAKIDANKVFKSWNERILFAKKSAQDGRVLLRKFDFCLAKVRRMENKIK